MYPHRPDLLSLSFGLLFTALGLIALVGDGPIPAGELLAWLALAGGLGLIGTLLTGDVHRQAAERLAARRAEVPLLAPPAADVAPHDDLFGPPIDPEELDRAFRARFGDDDGLAGGERAADGPTG